MFFYKEETTSIIGFTHGTLCRISTMRIEIQVAEVLWFEGIYYCENIVLLHTSTIWLNFLKNNLKNQFL